MNLVKLQKLFLRLGGGSVFLSTIGKKRTSYFSIPVVWGQL